MSDFHQTIEQKLKLMNPPAMTVEERAIMAMLLKTFYEAGASMTQKDLVRSDRWLQARPDHHTMLERGDLETPMRQVRKVINDLRTKYNAPIISDHSGYWICRSQTEAMEYLDRLGKEAKATVAAHFTTYNSMKRALNTTSQLFENLSLVIR